MPRVISSCLYVLACSPCQRAFTPMEVMLLRVYVVWMEGDGVICILSEETGRATERDRPGVWLL